jgi:hypothetical protein
MRDEKKNVSERERESEREKSPKKDVMIRFRDASFLSLHLFQSIVKYVQCFETLKEREKEGKRERQ